MAYFSVLGYSQNPILQKYSELYFSWLLSQLCTFPVPDYVLVVFQGIELQLKKDFLLHPDISSLIQDFATSKNQMSLEKLIREMSFLSSDTARLTQNQGLIIPGTNIRLTVIDNNPANTISGHPDHDSGEMIGWGEKSESEWLEVFSRSFALLREVNSDYFNELNTIIKKIVPMKTSRGVHNSCSYKECIGTLYLGYTVDSIRPELEILEAMIHESNHNKLNLIMQSEKIHNNNHSLNYYSPYRPDARHIHGVILGVHALVSAVYVMLQAIELGKVQDISWKEKIVLYHIKNKLGLRVLQKYALFTPIGSVILADMQAVSELCDKKIQDISLLKLIDIQKIQLMAKAHFLEVQTHYPHLQY